MASLHEFVGNPNAFSQQLKDGTWRPQRRELTADDLEKHLRGAWTIGTYTNLYDKARFIVFDDDTKDLGLVQRIAAECRARGLNAGVEFSGAKGYHVWVLFSDWHPADEVMRLGQHIAKAVGFNGEVFPKQAVAQDLGNLVKLPRGLHQRTGGRSRFIGAEPQLNTGFAFADAMKAVPTADRDTSRGSQASIPTMCLPCMDSLQEVPLRDGERHNSLFLFAVRLRRAGLHDEALSAALATLCDPNDLDPGEFEEIVQMSAEYPGVNCSLLSPDRRCPEDVCVQTRPTNWGSQRKGEVAYGEDGSKATFIIRHRPDGFVDLEHPDLSSARGAVRKQ